MIRNASERQIHPFMPTASLFLQCLWFTPLVLEIYSFGIEGNFGDKCAYATWLFTIFIEKIAILGIDSL